MPVVDVLIKFDTIPRLYAFTQITIHDLTIASIILIVSCITLKKNKETRQAAVMHESYMNSNDLMI